jgi:glycine cleavage system H protein
MTPDDLLFTKEHEWLRLAGDAGTIGISEHAQKQLGEIVYVDLPKPGTKYNAGETFGSVESVKAVSDLFMPVSGEVLAVNEDVIASPEKINQDSYGSGWMVRLRLTNRDEVPRLMSAKDYDAFTKKEE